jgi:hypothetical protein
MVPVAVNTSTTNSCFKLYGSCQHNNKQLFWLVWWLSTHQQTAVLTSMVPVAVDTTTNSMVAVDTTTNSMVAVDTTTNSCFK